MIVVLSFLSLFCLFVGNLLAGSGGILHYGIKDNEGKIGGGLFMVFASVVPVVIVVLALFGVESTYVVAHFIFAMDAILMPFLITMDPSYKYPTIKKVCIGCIAALGIVSGFKMLLEAFDIYFSLPIGIWRTADAVYVVSRIILLI